MARRFDLKILQGQDWSVTVPVLDVAGDPLSLVGYTATAQIRDGYGGALLHEWTELDDTMTLDATDIVLEVPAADSAEWAWRLGRWDLELVGPSGSVTRLVEGYVLVDPEVST